jgi:hypothetical protein
MFDAAPPPPDNEAGGDARRVPLILGAIGAVVALSAVAWWLTQPAPSPRAERAPAVARDTPAPRAEAPAKPPEEPAPPVTRDARPRTRPAPRPAAPAEPAPAEATPARELTIDTDVEGALVFLDRQFLGNAPVRTTQVTSGSHQINVSAEGYDGVARTVDVAESGPTSVTIRLKEVRLNESVTVVHKHGMGACQGQLTADLKGFHFVPQRGDDAFTLPLEAVESFEIDYLKKNLRLKRRGGRTWNFESPTGSADPLFVFHRDVEKARTRLAAAR